MSKPEVRLSIEQVNGYVRQLRDAAAVLVVLGRDRSAADVGEVADVLQELAEEAIDSDPEPDRAAEYERRRRHERS